MLNNSELLKKKLRLEELTKKIADAKAKRIAFRRKHKNIVEEFEKINDAIAKMEKELLLLGA
jgi:hypothetical protein